MDGLAALGVGDLVDRMGRGELTSAELTAALLDRVESIDAGPNGLRSVLQVNPVVFDEAEAADVARARGSRAPLLGVPVLVKDNIDTAAPMRTTAGSLALADSFAPRDAALVTALREAGAIVLGKTNLSEWANYRSASSSSGWSAVGGLTRNPHDRSRSAGGSSSGSGAAVAAGLAPLAVGTETDGSISCPASLNGVVGVKPTVGLIAGAGIVPISATQDTAGPMARSVRDAAALLTVLATRDLDYVACAAAGRLDGVRIGVPRSSPMFGYHRGADAAALAAIDVLADLGAEVVDDLVLPDPGTVEDAETTVLDHELRAGLATYLTARAAAGLRSLADVIAFDDAHPDTELEWFGHEIFLRADATAGLDSAVYLQARATCARVAAEFDSALIARRIDAIAMPSYAPAWSIDLVNGDRSVGGSSTLPAVAGYPLISVPCGTVPGPAGRLPVGLALTASAWSEPVLLRIAGAYEAARGPGPVPREP